MSRQAYSAIFQIYARTTCSAPTPSLTTAPERRLRDIGLIKSGKGLLRNGNNGLAGRSGPPLLWLRWHCGKTKAQANTNTRIKNLFARFGGVYPPSYASNFKRRSLVRSRRLVRAVPRLKFAPSPRCRSSLKPDYVVCLGDGKQLKMLKRHFMNHDQMTPDQYRQAWGLDSDIRWLHPIMPSNGARLG